MLAPMFSQMCWHFPKIYKLNQKLSKDHKAVGLTINFKTIKENTRYQNSPQHITEKIIVKDLTKEQIENIDKAIKNKYKRIGVCLQHTRIKNKCRNTT